ncbi:MAG: hypothetical protein RR058_05485 [Oscillospiraceae bacterium]
MGDKSIKKEVKKMKKSDKKPSISSTSPISRPAAVQPELVKKEKKFK